MATLKLDKNQETELRVILYQQIEYLHGLAADSDEPPTKRYAAKYRREAARLAEIYDFLVNNTGLRITND